MEDNISSAWLMYSIFHSENEDKYSKLTDLIAVADYSNHAIMTYSEFYEGLLLLNGLGFVLSEGDKLIVSELFKDWWTSKFSKKKRFYVQKEISEIAKYISKLIPSMTEETNFKVPSETIFNKSVNDYLKKMNSLI